MLQSWKAKPTPLWRSMIVAMSSLRQQTIRHLNSSMPMPKRNNKVFVIGFSSIGTSDALNHVHAVLVLLHSTVLSQLLVVHAHTRRIRVAALCDLVQYSFGLGPGFWRWIDSGLPVLLSFNRAIKSKDSSHTPIQYRWWRHLSLYAVDDHAWVVNIHLFDFILCYSWAQHSANTSSIWLLFHIKNAFCNAAKCPFLASCLIGI